MKTTSYKLLITCFILMLCAQLSRAQIQVPNAQTYYYLVHSSGKVAAENTDGRTILQNAATGNSQKLQFVSDGAGYYWLKLAGQQKYISLSGSWNTYFVADNSVDATKYAIEIVSASYIRLKCKANGKYLGADNTAAGSSVFSDKSGTDNNHYWYISEQFPIPESGLIQYNISANATYDKPFEGWGVSLCWWAGMCGKWDDAKIDEIVDWLVSPNGLNYNIFRYNIGGGDDPLNRNCTLHHMANGKGIRAEMDGFKSASNAPYDWSKDAAQRKIMLKIKAKRPDAIFEAFSNSAPYYMTYSGCCAGNKDASQDNVKPEYYSDFAHYLVDVCKHYKDTYNIEFKTLDPFNEPVTNFWGANGGQEGCHFSTASQIAFLKILEPVLKSSGLKTSISAADETSVPQAVTDYTAYASSNILNLMSQWNVHTYSADNKSRANVRSQSTFYQKTLWMSEVGSGGTGISGNLNLAKKLMDDMRYIRPEAWIDWQYMEEANDQWCLIKGSFANQTYQRVKNYYVRQQFSKYIAPGSKIVFVPNPQVLAAVNPAGNALVVVFLNNTSSAVHHKVELSQFNSIGRSISATRTSATENNAAITDFTLSGSTISIDLPDNSISTVVIPIGASTADKTIQTDVPYLIMARSANLLLQSSGTSVTINDFHYGDSTQMWKLTPSGNGYTISNLAGSTLTDNGGYYIIPSATKGNGQVFTLESIGDDHYKILSSSSGKALDLEGESNVLGTKVGLYAYGSNPAVAHRQWLLYPLPAQESPIAVQTVHLSAGWNLISTNVRPLDSTIATLFSGLDLAEIKTMDAFWRDGQLDYLNTLQSVTSGEGYLVKMNAAGDLKLIGTPNRDGSKNLGGLHAGWSLIGSPYQTATLMAGVLSSKFLSVKDLEGFLIPNNSQSTIDSFEPGKGYFLQLGN